MPRAPGVSCTNCRKARAACSAVTDPDRVPCDRCARSNGAKECIIRPPDDQERENNKRRFSRLPRDSTDDFEPDSRRRRLSGDDRDRDSVLGSARHDGPADIHLGTRSHTTTQDHEISRSYGTLHAPEGTPTAGPSHSNDQDHKVLGIDDAQHDYDILRSDGVLRAPSEERATADPAYASHPEYEILRSDIVRQPSEKRSTADPSHRSEYESLRSDIVRPYSEKRSTTGPLQHITAATPIPVSSTTPVQDVVTTRKIGNVELDSRRIADIFQHFDDVYTAQLPLPILQISLTPDQYYARSPLLFWSIIAVAARTWPRDPLLLKNLSMPVRDLALASLCERGLDVVQAFLLLMTWPLREDIGVDSLVPLAGATIMIARRAGLHRPAHGEDFVRARGVLSHRDLVSRTILWVHCLITYRSVLICKGHEPAPCLDIKGHELDGYKQFIPPPLAFRLDVSDCLVDCLMTMIKYGLEVIPPEREQGFKYILYGFADRMKAIHGSRRFDLSSSDTIFYRSHELVLLNLYFYLDICTDHYKAFHRLAQTACQVTLDVETFIQQDPANTSRVPIEMIWILLLSGTALIRLLRSSLSDDLGAPHMESCMYKAISALDILSRRDNRTAMRATMLLTQLAHSKRAFRKADGSPDTALRIRTRLNTSSVFDAARWWREEFEAPENVPPRAAILEGLGAPAEEDVGADGLENLNWMFLDFDTPFDMSMMGGNGML